MLTRESIVQEQLQDTDMQHRPPPAQDEEYINTNASVSPPRTLGAIKLENKSYNLSFVFVLSFPCQSWSRDPYQQG